MSKSLDYIEDRIAYGKKYRSQFPEEFRSGFSGAESGPCCEKCVMDTDSVIVSGRAVALRLMVSCRNPFQLSEVCECHLVYRQVAEQAIIKELENMRFMLFPATRGTKATEVVK